MPWNFERGKDKEQEDPVIINPLKQDSMYAEAPDPAEGMLMRRFYVLPCTIKQFTCKIVQRDEFAEHFLKLVIEYEREKTEYVTPIMGMEAETVVDVPIKGKTVATVYLIDKENKPADATGIMVAWVEQLL